MNTKQTFPIPNLNLRYIEVPFDPRYIFYEDGRMYSRKSGCFMTSYFNTKSHKKRMYILSKHDETGRQRYCTFIIDNNIRKYFLDNPPKIDGVRSKDMKRYQGKYVIYQDGRVWSLMQCRWMTACKNDNGYYLYCLFGLDNKRKTEYLHRLLAQNFLASGQLDDLQVHHLSKQVDQNTLDNLQIITHAEHVNLHKTRKRGKK